VVTGLRRVGSFGSEDRVVAARAAALACGVALACTVAPALAAGALPFASAEASAPANASAAASAKNRTSSPTDLDAEIDGLGLDRLGGALGIEIVIEGRGVVYSRDPSTPRPAASAIKTAIALDLLAERADVLNDVPVGVQNLLSPGMHPAFRGFSAAQLDEARRALAGKTYLELARIMMGRTEALNDIYNAACNVLMVKLGGPAAINRRLHERDPAFAGFDVNRYMLTWDGDGDNMATPEALVNLYRMTASGHVPGLDAVRVDTLRELILDSGTGGPGSVYEKAGTLYPKPIARVHAGYVTRPEGTLVYAIMGEVADTGSRAPGDVFVELLNAVDTVTMYCRDLAEYGTR
jgi:hypothetical protein